jgi:hypothetical protein
MPVVKRMDMCQHLKGARRVTLSCGHVLIQTMDNSLLALEQNVVCEACLRREQKIVRILTDPLFKTFKVTFDPCGHEVEYPYSGPLTYDTVGDFINTAMRCKSCQKAG